MISKWEEEELRLAQAKAKATVESLRAVRTTAASTPTGAVGIPVKRICQHAPSTNPRIRTCVKCGKFFDPPKPKPQRDREAEAAFLNDACEAALRVTGIVNNLYPASVSQRLDVGESRYGDTNYLRSDVDLMKEIREETPDIAAYAVLELQKQKARMDPEVWAELRLNLVACAAYAAVSDWFAQRAAELVP